MCVCVFVGMWDALLTPFFLCSCEAEYNLGSQHLLKRRVLRSRGEHPPPFPLINSALSLLLVPLSIHSVLLVLSVFIFLLLFLPCLCLTLCLKFSVFQPKSSEAAPPSTSPSSQADRSRQEVQFFAVFCAVVMFCCGYVLLSCRYVVVSSSCTLSLFCLA